MAVFREASRHMRFSAELDSSPSLPTPPRWSGVLGCHRDDVCHYRAFILKAIRDVRDVRNDQVDGLAGPLDGHQPGARLSDVHMSTAQPWGPVALLNGVVRLQPFPASVFGPGSGAASDGDGEVVVLLPPHADAKNTSRTTDTPRFLDIG